MSHRVHLTFREGEEITFEKIARARRELVRTRETPMGDRWSADGEYFVMQIPVESEIALRADAKLREYFQPAMVYTHRRPVLPEEIGSIMGFRVVAR